MAENEEPLRACLISRSNNPGRRSHMTLAIVANDGLRRFAAPISFSRFSLAPGGQMSVSLQNKEIDMPIGTVKFFDNAKGYGFITNEAGGDDAFVPMTAVQAAGMSSLEKEQRLSYQLENDKRGKKSAVDLQPA